MNTIFLELMNYMEGKNEWERFYNVHFNTGNLVFSELLKKEINYSNLFRIDEMKSFDKNAVYVLPLSNNLSVDETCFTRLLYKIARYNLNVVPIGLGVQAELDETPEKYIKKIPSRKKRLIQSLAANTNTIGVRGEFTGECLELMGIKNYRVVGCPSFYSNKIKQNYRKKEKANYSNNSIGKICLNMDLNCEEKIKIKEASSISVIQTVPEYIRNKNERGNRRIFFSLNSWNDFIEESRFDLALGNRFHGNMMCYLNDVPTIWIVKDYRVKELVDTLGLPFLENEFSIKKMGCIHKILEMNGEKEGRIKKIRKEYIEFLNENRINHFFEGI